MGKYIKKIDDAVLGLFKKVCRYYYGIYQEMITYQVAFIMKSKMQNGKSDFDNVINNRSNRRFEWDVTSGIRAIQAILVLM